MVDLVHAQRVASLGLRPLWLMPPTVGGKSAGKMPMFGGWQMPYAKPEEIERPPRPDCNLGVRTGWVEGAKRRVIVVDVDDFKAMEWALANLPATPWRTTTSRGEHWYYADPRQSAEEVKEFAITNKAKLKGIGLDVRGDGGLVVVSPSIHQSGDTYVETVEWQDSDVLPPFDVAWLQLPSREEQRGKKLRTAGLAAEKYSEGDRHPHLLRTATKLVSEGLDAETVKTALRGENVAKCVPPKPVEEVDAISAWATGTAGVEPGDDDTNSWETQLVRDSKGRLVRSSLNVAIVLQNDPRWKDRLRFDEFHYDVHVRGDAPWHSSERGGDPTKRYSDSVTDADIARMRMWMLREYNLDVNNGDVSDAMLVTAEQNRFHPVRDWLLGLKWDGKGRVEYALNDWFGAERNLYTRTVGIWFAVSCVARAMKPGCAVDTVMILEGGQGFGKSKGLRALCGAPWFHDTPFDLSTKDANQAMQGKWLIEWAELDQLNRVESSRAKAFITSQVDRFRKPFGKHMIEVPRSAVCVGTVNHDVYLKDDTGNRRYLPIKCGIPGEGRLRDRRVDLKLIEAEREQYWAEAVDLYQGGTCWWPETPEQVEMCRLEQAKRQTQEPWVAAVNHYCKLKVVQQARGFTMDELLEKAIGILPSHQSHGDAVRMGRVLARIGWAKLEVEGEIRYIPTSVVPANSVPF